MSEFQLVLQWDAEVETPDDLGAYYRHKMTVLAAGHLDSDDVLSIENLLESSIWRSVSCGWTRSGLRYHQCFFEHRRPLYND